MTSVPPSIRGGIQMFVPPAAGSVLAARWELSTNFATAGSFETVPWDTVVFDQLGVTAAHTSEFTVQVDGYYLVECEVECGNSSDTEPFATIALNGVDIAFDQKVYDLGGLVGTAAYFHLSTGINQFTAGQRLTVGIESQVPGAVIDGPAPYNNFTLVKFG